MSNPTTSVVALPKGMLEWARTASLFASGLTRAYPQGAPTEAQSAADQLSELASRAVTLEEAIQKMASAMERLEASGASICLEIEARIAAEEGDASPAARERVEKHRSDRQRFLDALAHDVGAGRAKLEARVREAQACEHAFIEACQVLVNHLQDAPDCRDLLQESHLPPYRTRL